MDVQWIAQAKAHRQKLAAQLKSNSLAIITAGALVTRSHDVEYPFRQDSDFWYFTAFAEPDAVLILRTHQGELETILFCHPKDPATEIWTGLRMGPEAAPGILGIDKAYPLAALEQYLGTWWPEVDALYYQFGKSANLEKAIDVLWHGGDRKKQDRVRERFDLGPLMHAMRVYKSPLEIKYLEHAIAVSVKAHERLFTNARHCEYEYQLEALLTETFIANDCQIAYSPIVGSGNNACILHYIENRKKLDPKELVLVDAGAEYYGFAADITRTFPIGGKWTGPQRDIYNLVLAAQKKAIAEIKPGAYWGTLQRVVVETLLEGLMDLKILPRQSVQSHYEQGSYKPYYMHGSGHWLGLDVHDVGAYETADHKPRPLEAGMVLTVEPGLYFHPVLSPVAEPWQGIGVRIEDDVLVTETGCKVLSGALAKELADLDTFLS